MIIADPHTKTSTTTNDGGGRHDLTRQVTHIKLKIQTSPFDPFPEPTSSAELDEWLRIIEISLKDGGIPRSQWSDAAILFLDVHGDVNDAMRKFRDRRLRQGFDTWTWEEFTATLRELLAERDSRSFSLRTLRNDHPIATTVAGSLLVAAVSPPLFVGALNVLGFGSGGVAPGSIAAGAQSAFYGGATSGLFALCQSVGATGLGAAATTLTSAIGGVAGFTLLGACVRGGKRKREDDHEDEDEMDNINIDTSMHGHMRTIETGSSSYFSDSSSGSPPPYSACAYA